MNVHKVVILMGGLLLFGCVQIITSPSAYAGEPQPPATNDPAWQAAMTEFDNQRFVAAARLFETYASSRLNHPFYKLSLYYQGLAERRAGKEGQAVTTWKHLLSLAQLEQNREQATLLTLNQLALFHQERGQEQQVQEILAQMAKEFPDDPLTVERHAASANAYIEKGKYKEAMACYRPVAAKLEGTDRANAEATALLLKPEAQNAETVLQFAGDALTSDQVDKARMIYQYYLKNHGNTPGRWEAMTKMGWCLFLKKEENRAEKMWRDVIAKAPADNYWVGKSRWHLIALMAGPRGKVNDAVELCEVQAKAFDDNMLGEQAMFVKAWLYWTQKNWAKAKTAFDELLAKYPARGAHPPMKQYLTDCENGLKAKRGDGR